MFFILSFFLVFADMEENMYFIENLSCKKIILHRKSIFTMEGKRKDVTNFHKQHNELTPMELFWPYVKLRARIFVFRKN